MIRTALQPTGTVAGAFALGIDAEVASLRLVEWGVKMRSHFWQMPYGDQAIFLTKQTFNKIGNFPELPFMEDFEIMRRLKPHRTHYYNPRTSYYLSTSMVTKRNLQNHPN